jgi:hypothetical protein
VRCEYVVDEFASSSVDAAVARPLGRQEPVEVPHPVAVAAVAGSEARSGSKVDLRPARALNDLRGGRQGLVVQVPAEDHRVCLPRARALSGLVATCGQHCVECGSAGHGLGGAPVERVPGVAQPFTLIVRGERAAADHAGLAGVGDEFGLEMGDRHRDKARQERPLSGLRGQPILRVSTREQVC